MAVVKNSDLKRKVQLIKCKDGSTVRYAQFLVRITVRLFCKGSGTVRLSCNGRVRYVGTLFEFVY